MKQHEINIECQIKINKLIKGYIRAAYAFLPDEYHLGSLLFINKVRKLEKEYFFSLQKELLENNNSLGEHFSHIYPDSSHKEYFLAFVDLYQGMIWSLAQSENKDPKIIKEKFNELNKEYGYKEFFTLYVQAIQHYLERLLTEGSEEIESYQ